MNKFKIGDVVIPHRPFDTNVPPYWISSMDNMDGKEYEVIGLTASKRVILKNDENGSRYVFLPEWLEYVGREIDVEEIPDFITGI